MMTISTPAPAELRELALCQLSGPEPAGERARDTATRTWRIRR